MNTVTDPVCGMTIDPAEAAGSSTYDGTTHHFCSRGCQRKFDGAPALYAGSTTAAAASCGCAGGNATATACH
jgi:Cu+-exporting ATPase